MATSQHASTGIRYRTRYAVGVPLAVAAVAAPFVIGAVVGSDDAPTRGSAVSGPTPLTASQAIASQDFGEELKGVYPAIGLSDGAARAAIIERAMADGATWRALTRDFVGTRAVPDMEATDGVFPIPGASNVAPATTPTLDPALYETALFEGAIFESLVEQMLHGDQPARTSLPPAASITDDPEMRAMIEQHQAWLEPQILLEP